MENNAVKVNQASNGTFMFTDNTNAEDVYHNVTSSRPELFEFFIILRKLELY